MEEAGHMINQWMLNHLCLIYATWIGQISSSKRHGATTQSNHCCICVSCKLQIYYNEDLQM